MGGRLCFHLTLKPNRLAGAVSFHPQPLPSARRRYPSRPSFLFFPSNLWEPTPTTPQLGESRLGRRLGVSGVKGAFQKPH